jgi:hypothetical protein
MALSLSPHTVLWEEVGAGGEEAGGWDGDEAERDREALAASGAAADGAGSSGGSSPVVAPAAAGVEAGGADFTDPLRRKTPIREAARHRSSLDAAAALSAAEAAAAARSPWLAGLALYDRQRIFLSMACRNPRKQLLCEPPSIKRIDYYCHRCAWGGLWGDGGGSVTFVGAHVEQIPHRIL